MLRAFKYIAIRATDTAQPMLSTTLSAAITASVVANDNMVPTSIQVGDSALFLKADLVAIGLPSTATFEIQPVIAIADSTHITVARKFAHASGEVVYLMSPASIIYIQEKDGNAGDLFIASNENGKVAGTFCIHRMAKVASAAQGAEWKVEQHGQDSESTGNVWVVGTQNDTYLPSFSLV